VNPFSLRLNKLPLLFCFFDPQNSCLACGDFLILKLKSLIYHF
jgi:hypothetical protein